MITVIGGSGFIGTRVCTVLAERGIPFEIIDLNKSRSFPNETKIADIRDVEALRQAVSGDTIIHLAAVHRDDVRDKSLYYSTNVEGTRNICDVAAEKDIKRVVFTSTVAVYGFAAPDTNEQGRINPFNDYGRSKFEGEEVLRAWWQQDKHLTIVRPTVVFGEGNRGNVFNLLNQIAQGRFLMVGRGENRKSMAYVGNVAEFLIWAASGSNGSLLVNYVDKPDFDMNHLVSSVRGVLNGKKNTGPRLPYTLGLALGYVADFVSHLSGKSLPVSSIRVKKFCATTAFSSAAHDLPGFAAPTTLEAGLERTLISEFLEPDPDREVFFTE